MGKSLVLFLPIISDTLALIVSGMCAYLLRTSSLFYVEHYIKNPRQYIFLLITTVMLWHIIMLASGAYKARPTIFQIGELLQHFKSTIMLLFVLMAGTFLYKQYDFSRLIVFFSWIFFVFSGNIGRQIVHTIRTRLYKKGIGLRNACLVGQTSTREFLEQRIKDNKSCGLELVGPKNDKNDDKDIGNDKDKDKDKDKDNYKKIDAFLKTTFVDELFLFTEKLDYNKVWMLRDCSLNTKMIIHLVPSFGNLYSRNLQGLFFDGTVMISLDSPLTRQMSLGIKRAIDVLISAVFLVLLFPFFTLISMLIKLGSKGPVFFIQTRTGQNKIPFKIIKFRTMAEHAKAYEETPTDSQDSRITGFGRVLRATGLDELPQLWNVLKGEMSLVGPRPEMPFITDKYTSVEEKRLKTKPGITGLWQIYARSERLPIHHHIEYDLYYVENISVMLDVMIILDTIPAIILQKGV